MTTSTAVRPNQTLAELATTRAGASRVFHRLGLDFCCGGQISLAEACQRRGIDAAALAREIEREERGTADFVRWSERPLAELIEHILDRYHAPLREELPRLLEMAAKVERVHGEKKSCPFGLHRELEALAAELLIHMQKEEEVLFPMILEGRGHLALGPVHVMEAEHRDAGAALQRLRAITGEHQPPVEACGTWRALYLGLVEFERELMDHISLENNVLFPRALGN